jgi:tetratricopeptide (TPR) repeat protein
MRRSAVKLILGLAAIAGLPFARAGAQLCESRTEGLVLRTSDQRLAAAFAWARRQAEAYAFTGDPVGDWYEAALPGREAFCMRDTAHQALGAHVLGMSAYTRNMLRKFAENISDSKDWCSYWEIDSYNRPPPVDYRDDAHFWYNLPANFDVLDACYRMYVWTGDRTYLTDPAFLNFYRRTVHDYVDRWDLSLDRIMDRPRIMNIRGHFDPHDRFQTNRGIPSYEEADRNFVVAIDQIAAEYAGYLAYARLQQLMGNDREAARFFQRATDVRSFLNGVWWNSAAGNYYSRVGLDHKLSGDGLNLSVLYYGAAEGSKTTDVLNRIVREIHGTAAIGIEEQSHLPEILYRYGKPEDAFQQILDLTRQGKYRREYPEDAYSVIGAIVTGLMGIEIATAAPEQALRQYDYVDKTITTLPRLPQGTDWAEVQDVPVRANKICVRHDGLKKTRLLNASGPSLMWRACFPGPVPVLAVDGSPMKAAKALAPGGEMSCVTIPVGAGDATTVQVPE